MGEIVGLDGEKIEPDVNELVDAMFEKAYAQGVSDVFSAFGEVLDGWEKEEITTTKKEFRELLDKLESTL